MVLGISLSAQIQNFLKHSWVKEKIALCGKGRYGEKFVCALKKKHFQLIQVQCHSFQDLHNFHTTRLTENNMTMSWQHFFNFARNREINVCVWAATGPADD